MTTNIYKLGSLSCFSQTAGHKGTKQMFSGWHVQLVLVMLTISVVAIDTSCFGQGTTTTVAETQQPTGTDGEFALFTGVQLNNSSQISFGSFLQNTDGGGADDFGFFLWDAGEFSQVVREGQVAPDGDGTYFSFSSQRLNESGTAAFQAILSGTSGGSTDNEGIFRGNNGVITQIARKGQAAPDGNGVFDDFNPPFINDSGTASFLAELTGTSGGFSDDTGIFQGSGGAITQNARKGQAAPDGDGVLAFLGNYDFNNSGTTTFNGFLTGNSGGSSDDNGLFRSSGGEITQVAREGQTAPDDNGTFSSVVSPNLNNSGAIAFRADLTGTSGGISDDNGVFRSSGGAITQVVREGQSAPDGNGTFSSFGFSQELNDSNTIAFRAILTGTSGGNSDSEGIFRDREGPITQIARAGEASPDGNGTFFLFDPPVLNDSDSVAFLATLTGTSGGSTDNSGVFLADGIELIQVVRKGESAAGSTISDFAISQIGATGLNDFGQIAYRATLDDGRQIVQLFTPHLYYRPSADGIWDDTNNWTLSLNPGPVHDVFIAPDVSVDVLGPAGSVSVDNLEIGAGFGFATLNLAGGNIESENGVQILPNGRLTGEGQITSGAQAISNAGVIAAENITINGHVLSFGEITGNGRLHANGQLVNQLFVEGDAELSATEGIINTPTGQFLVGDDESISASGFFNSFTNQGLLGVIGGELEIQGPTTNSVGTGLITLRDGILRFNDGQLNNGLTNDGSIGVTFGISDIFGDINNMSTGVINITGGANATFYDDVTQNGTMVVASVGQTHSAAVFFGSFGGTGGFTGGGDVFAAGDLRPGASPASVLMDGNLFLSSSTITEIELAGTSPDEFDQMIVTGDLALGGELFVNLIDGFELSANDQFLIAEVAGNLSGQFQGLSEGELVDTFGAIELYITYTGGDGNDVVLIAADPSILLGDVNLDGVVNLLDVAPFIDRLSAGIFQAEADVNQDGVVNLLDVDPFIVLLSGG